VSGLHDSAVLVAGRFFVAATARAAVGAAVGATVDEVVAIGAAVGAVVGVTVGAADGAAVNGGRVGGMTTGGAALHIDVLKWSLISVTSPLRASALPWTVTALSSVMDVIARIVPTKEEPEPRVAELVTCQKTLHGLPPLMNTTELVDAVMRSDVAWKIHTEFGLFWPSSVSVPVRSSVTPPAL
jgi:hypothetical protein